MEELPATPGVYVWVTDDASGAVVYIGSASGKGGLRKRIGDEVRWRDEHAAEIARDALSRVVLSRAPIVRAAVEDGLAVHFAEAAPPSWALGDPSTALPQTAKEWEGFIAACAHIVAARRASIGGSAWNQAATTLIERMFPAAWARLHDSSVARGDE